MPVIKHLDGNCHVYVDAEVDLDLAVTVTDNAKTQKYSPCNASESLLVARGVRRLVVAGGETSGAVVQRLGVRSLRIGAEIDPGVPWCWSEAGGGIHLALKSGNFGARDMFLKAFDHV